MEVCPNLFKNENIYLRRINIKANIKKIVKISVVLHFDTKYYIQNHHRRQSVNEIF